MRAVALRPGDEEARIESDAAALARVELHHPAVDAVRIELLIDRAVERVGEIDALSVPADLDHLRSAVEPPARPRVGRAREDAANPDRAGELGLERIADGVLAQIARPPARDIKEAVVHRQID